MLGRFAKRFMVLALVLVTAGHWALLQSIAWVGMAVSYSQNGTLKEALVKTFDGQHPCKLCKAVQEGKKSERKQAPQKPIIKLDFFCPAASAAMKRTALLPVSTYSTAAISGRAEAPPKPPPRQA